MKQYFIALLSVLMISCGGDDTTIVYQIEAPDTQNTSNCTNLVRRTTLVSPQINLSASATTRQKTVQQIISQGVEVAQAQVGLINATTTALRGTNFTLPLANDFSSSNISFDITLSGQGNNIGTVTVNLDTSAGVPASVSTFNDLRILASVINAQLFSPQAPQAAIDLVVSALDLGGGNYALEFSVIEEGLVSVINLSNLSANASQIGLSSALASVSGIPAVSNGYSAQSIDFTNGDDNTVTYNIQAGSDVETIAQEINALQGVSASAQTQLTLSNYVNAAGNMQITLNGVELSSTTMSDLSDEINQLSNTQLSEFSSEYNESPVSITVTNAIGEDIRLQIDSSDDGDQITLTGNTDTASVTLEVDAANDGLAGANSDANLNMGLVGGVVTIQLDEGYSMSPNNISGLFQALTSDQYEQVEVNEFSRDDSVTFNYFASDIILDSLGIEHNLALYFVKQAFSAQDAFSRQNHWKVYAFIDDENVGDPDTTLPPPQNFSATVAQFDLTFYSNGNISEQFENIMLISNWVPLDEDGEPNSAAGPQNVLAGGSLPVAEPPTSSNFAIDFGQLTQIGDEYMTYSIEQNGRPSQLQCSKK